jgi:hypothetical protein
MTIPTGAGDSCVTPLEIPSSGGVQSFSFSGYTAVHTPFSCGSSAANSDVAFRWTPALSGFATMRAAGSVTSVDTTLAVFASASCSSPDELACNDDEPAGTVGSTIELSVTAGTTYYLVVSYYSTLPSETITLTVTAP